MNRFSRGAALIAVIAGVARPALAADVLSSSYWDAAYLNSRVEDGGARFDMEGFRFAASLGLAPFLDFAADYDQRRFDGGRIGFGSAGLAWHTQDPVYRFHAGVSYERVVTGGSGQSSYEDGYGVELGARYALPHAELHAAYRYLDFGTIDGVDFTGARYGAGAALQLSAWWSLTADYRVREHDFEGGGATATTDYSEWTVGLRRYFATATDRRARM
ncbi:MAG: hypothetical protein ACRES8_05050 [Nevskiaceae bacterium]